MSKRRQRPTPGRPHAPAPPLVPAASAAPAARMSVPALAVLALAIAVLVAHAASYLPFMADDAFISLRYARRLLDGHGLTWNDGEVVEGYSNLLWTLACAALGRLGLDLVVAARALGFAGSGAAIAAVVWMTSPSGWRAALPALAGGLALGLAGPLACWTVGGLESPLLAGLLAWALVLIMRLLDVREPTARDLIAPGLLLGLICLTRPDGALFTVAACLGLVAARGADPRTLGLAARLAVIPAVLYLSQLAFRLGYYHEWVPNSARAKLGLASGRVLTGAGYVASGAVSIAALLVPALAAFFMGGRDAIHRGRVRILGVTLGLWALYVVIIGGDIFPARRHLVPVVVILALLLSLTVARVSQDSRRPRAGVWIGVGLCLGILGVMQIVDPENQRARTERWEWEGRAVGQVLARAFGTHRPLLAVDPAGCVPYFSGLPSVDMLGLNDSYLAHHPPSDFGRGWLGHELGGGDYVLRREPDLVLFCLPQGSWMPCFRSGLEMISDPRFRAGYRPVIFQTDLPALRSNLWARTEGGRIGIQRRGDQVIVPGFLLGTGPTCVARLDERGRPGMWVSPKSPAGLAGLALEPGRWRLTLDRAGAAVEARVRAGDGLPPLGQGGDTLAFDLGSGVHAVTIEIATARPEGALVRGVELQRMRGK